MPVRVHTSSRTNSARARPLHGLAIEPIELLRRWPAARPLACLWADGDASARPWARWTVIAEPTECRTWESVGTRDKVAAEWRRLTPERGAGVRSPEIPTFQGGWIGCLGYGLGSAIEPAAVGSGKRPDGGEEWPRGVWLRCPGALVHDGWTGRWWAVGEESSGELVDGLKDAGEVDGEEFSVAALTSGMGRRAFEAAVARAVEYIRAGDVFQVNLSHRLSGAFSGSARALFRAMVERSRPRHGAYLEVPGARGMQEGERAIVSASPEMFLSYDAATRVVTTRPMKGTRAARPGGAGYPELQSSEKDRAELAMIVDLMRNDLGRVCEFGSIRVTEPRVIERHGMGQGSGHGSGGGGVYQGVATVQGRVREGLDTADLLCATFPGGSVTGAPKIRAMQIIEELEPVARGPYCGAIGMVSETGDVMLNIAIRTAAVSGQGGRGRLDYSVGAGIVAESEPAAEWEETMDKAGAIVSLTEAPEGAAR